MSIDTADLASKVISVCREIALCTEAPSNTTRTFLSPPIREVHRLLGNWMESLGMASRVDSVGNLRGVYEADGPDAKRLLIGSHLDTVPNAGAFDGVLGVVLGIALVEGLQGRRLPISIEIIGFSEEEGVRFGFPFIGSKALVGELDDTLLDRRDSNGISVREAIVDFGLNPANLADAKLSEDVFGYLEFHIEQGPELEARGERTAFVSSIVGQTRLRLIFEGKANHAGTTPMHLRRDALAAAATWMVGVEREACEIPGLVATVGKISVAPGAENVIPGEAALSLDLRHSEDEVRESAVIKLCQGAKNIALDRGLSVNIFQIHAQKTVPMDANMQALLSAATISAGNPIVGTQPATPSVMASGAGHDAMILAPHVPSGMIFLRSPGGISHHPEETVLTDDVQLALEIGLKFLEMHSADA